jgi:phosphatidate cytidylyltransferase
MAAVVLVALSSGPTVFSVLLGVAAAVLAWEWTRLCGGGRFGWTGFIQAIAVVGVVVAASVSGPLVGISLVLAGIVGDYVAARVSGRRHPRWIAAGTAYIGLPSIALLWLRGSDTAGQWLILWLFVIISATDIGAFFAGRLIGGPLLAPAISPKKTWAGLAGGALSAAVVGALIGGFFDFAPSPVNLAITSGILAVVAQAGDLAESLVKRRFGAKDASALIPGHGGLFDRVDGLLVAALALAVWQWITGGTLLAWR